MGDVGEDKKVLSGVISAAATNSQEGRTEDRSSNNCFYP